MSRRRRSSASASRRKGGGGAGAKRRSAPLLLQTAFFLGGTTSLALQVAWSKQLSYLLGSSLAAVSTVVASFMCGLGLGSLLAARFAPRLARPFRAYALLQVAIALCGALSIPLLAHAGPVISWLWVTFASPSSQGLFVATRFLFVFSLLLLPVTLMGWTLPLVVGGVARRHLDYAGDAGALYGLNTMGAVLGTLVTGFWAVPAIGLSKTCLLAALLDALVAGLAWTLDRRRGPSGLPADLDSEGFRPAGSQLALIAIFALTGALALGFEIAAFRLITLAVGPSVQAFTSMLAIYLVGIAGGSLLGARRARGPADGALARASRLALALAATILASLFALRRLPHLYAWIFERLPAALADARMVAAPLLLALPVVLLPCLLMGAQFPAFVQAFGALGRRKPAEAEVGWLYTANTFGGVAGSLIAGFLLLPRAGSWQTLRLLGALFFAAAVALRLLGRRPCPWREIVAGGAVIALLGAVSPAWSGDEFHRGRYRSIYHRAPWSQDEPTLLYQREGRNAPVAVFNFQGIGAINVSGKTDASTGTVDRLTQRLIGHVPALLHPRPRKVALVGYGSGMTADALLRHRSVESLTIAELEEAVVEAAHFFRFSNHRPLADPRADLVVEDGRAFLQQTPKTFDLIVSQPSNPWIAGVGNLFTLEFYETVRDHLAEGGLFAQWMQTYEMSKTPFAVVLATLREVFPHVLLFRMGPGDELFVASEEPIVLPWSRWRDGALEESVADSLRSVDVPGPEALLFHFRGRAESLSATYRDAPFLHRDDRPWLEHELPFQILLGSSSPLLRELNETTADRLPEELSAVYRNLPLREVLFAIVDYEHASEPRTGLRPARDPRDPDLSIHPVRVRRALSRAGHHELAEKIRQRIEVDRAAAERRERIAASLGEAILTGRFPDREEVREAWLADPALPITRLAAARLLLEEGSYEEAKDVVSSIGTASPLRYLALLGLAQTAAAGARSGIAGMGGEAVDLFTLAIQQNPFRAAAFLELADFLEDAGQQEAWRRTLELAHEFHPESRDLAARRQRAGL